MPTKAPTADWIDTAQLLDDPYPTYARLRAESPVAYVPRLNRYFISGYRDCFDVEMDQDTFSSYERAETSTMLKAMGRPLLRKDDPQHKAERNAMAPALRPIALKKHWSSAFEANARRHLESLRAAGPGADLFRLFAVPYAADNLSAVIGFHDVSPEQMMDWSHTLIRGIGNVTGDPAVWAETTRVCAEIDDAIDAALSSSSDADALTLISQMTNAGTPEEDLRANVRLTVSGGMNEPSHVIASAVWCLSAFPAQGELVESGQRTWRDVFEETARFHSPVGMYPRRVTRDTSVGGVAIPRDATVAVIVASANRDSAQFQNADQFDLTRDATSHLAFGNGTHICAGNWVARSMIGDIALPLLYDELPDLRAIDPDSTDYHGWVFRGARSLPVTWTA